MTASAEDSVPLNQRGSVLSGGRIVEGVTCGFRSSGVRAGCKYLFFGAICIGLAACTQTLDRWEKDIKKECPDTLDCSHKKFFIESGTSVENARANARKEIANILETKTKVRLTCTIFLRETKGGGDQQSVNIEECEKFSSVLAIGSLSDTKPIKETRKPIKGKYYVAMQYDSRTMYQQIVDFIIRQDTRRECESQENLLGTTYFHRFLRWKMGPNSCVPNWQLSYADRWIVSIREREFPLGHNEVEYFFPESSSDNVEIVLPQNGEMDAGIRYKVQVRANKEDGGYLTLLQANEFGHVQLLDKDVQIKPDAGLVDFPKTMSMKTNLYGYEYGKELFVALLCSEENQFSTRFFPKLRTGKYPTEHNYGKLLLWLSDNLSGSGCDLALSQLRINKEPS